MQNFSTRPPRSEPEAELSPESWRVLRIMKEIADH